MDKYILVVRNGNDTDVKPMTVYGFFIKTVSTKECRSFHSTRLYYNNKLDCIIHCFTLEKNITYTGFVLLCVTVFLNLRDVRLFFFFSLNKT